MNEQRLREALVERGRSLYDRGYAHGSSGNLSARIDDGIENRGAGEPGIVDLVGGAEKVAGAELTDLRRVDRE
mgnify:CR=1 FL=1